jgi:hypothetical protein
VASSFVQRFHSGFVHGHTLQRICCGVHYVAGKLRVVGGKESGEAVAGLPHPDRVLTSFLLKR